MKFLHKQKLASCSKEWLELGQSKPSWQRVVACGGYRLFCADNYGMVAEGKVMCVVETYHGIGNGMSHMTNIRGGNGSD